MTEELVNAARAALADGRPSVALANPGHVAIYESRRKTANLLGEITIEDWTGLLEERLNLTRHEGGALEADGSISPTVRDIDSAKERRLRERKERLEARIAADTARLAELDAQLS
ncbi:MAG: hypothetical protein AAF567_24580 [Actinomycetota bacterium]